MNIKYKCPVCKANNLLNKQNRVCRRCKSDLSNIYKIKEKKNIKILQTILEREK